MPVKKDKDIYVLLGEEDRALVEKAGQTGVRTAAPAGAVARRAYERFLARGGSHGHDVEDWLAAERELRGF